MSRTNQVAEYVSLIYNSLENRVCLCLIKDGERPIQRFIEIGNLEKFIPFLKAKNVQGWNVYITPSVLKSGANRRTKDNFLGEQDIIYLDCDDKKAMEEVKTRYPYPALVVKTSPGRYQIYWKLSEPTTISAQEELMRRIAIDVEADRAATDVSRLLRLPSFWNRKPNRHNTVDVVFRRDSRITYINLSSVPNVASVALAHSTSIKHPSLPPSVCKDKEFKSESERDWYLINSWLRSGISRDECIRRIIERRHRDKRNVQRYAEYSVDKAIGLQGGCNGKRI